MIYFDNNATTPIDPRVMDAMVDACKIFGNPSSTHAFGREAKSLLIKSRDTIADYLNTDQEIIFHSGATEGLNTLICGIAKKNPKGHIITSDLEHPAVFYAAKALEKSGYDVTFLSSGLKGAVSREDVEAAIRENTCLISIMAVNNETGIKTDINAIALLAKERKIPFVVDGVALMGKESFAIPDGVAAMVFSGHKFHSPKGIGFSFVRRDLDFSPLLLGGQQEHNKRAGTENMLGIVALAKAVEIFQNEQDSIYEHVLNIRNYFEKSILKKLPNVKINGFNCYRVNNTSNVTFPSIDGELLLMKLDLHGIAAGYGSACSSGTLEPSRVLLNMGYKEPYVESSLRFSFSRFNTKQEVNITIKTINSLQ